MVDYIMLSKPQVICCFQQPIMGQYGMVVLNHPEDSSIM